MRWQTHRPEPGCLGGGDASHIVDMTFQELDTCLKIGKGQSVTPFINLFKLLHLNDDAPRNHNVLLEGKDSACGLVIKQRHWRRVEDVQGMLRDCLCETAGMFLDIEELLMENMERTCFRRFWKLRDRVGRVSSLPCVRASAEIQKILDRMHDAIVHFTASRPELLAYAKADNQVAPPLVEATSVRDLSSWQPGGERYEAFRATSVTSPL